MNETLGRGGGATSPSIIREIQEVHGREETPHNGGAILFEDVQMKPFSLEGFNNSMMSVRVPSGPTGVNRLLGGHVDLNYGHPSLLQDFAKGILIVEVLSASLRLEKVKDEASEDVKGLPDVGVAPDVVALKVGWIVIAFEDDFPQQNEGPRRGGIVRCPPFLPNIFESVPSTFGNGAFEEVVLRDFQGLYAIDLVGGGDAHTLKPGFNKQPLVEGQPDEGAHFARV